MDKYYINANSKGLVELVGVQTENGFEKIEITDLDNPSKYMEQILAINEKYGKDFIATLNSKNIKLASKRNIEKKYVESVIPGSSNIRRQVLKKKAMAVAAVAMVAIGGSKLIADAANVSFKDALKNIKTKTLTTSMFGVFNNDEEIADVTTQEDLEGKSVKELIDMLKTKAQKRAFKKIVKTQDYFNEEAAPTVRQGDKQLFFTFDETTSAYLYANAKALGSEKLASIFGKSKIMLLNPATDEYETMDKDLVAANYLSFNLNLSYYYQLGATTKSGVDQIFENDEEAEFFRNFEAKILEYNKTKSDKTKEEINQMLQNIFMSGQIDSPMTQYEGACSIIGTSMVPYLYLNHVISEDMYKSLVEINESITCDDIYNQIGKVMSLSKENGQENIIEQIAKLQNHKIMGLDRNLDMSNAIDGYSLEGLDNAVFNSTSGFKKKRTVTKHYRTVTKDRNKAIKKTSKKQVEEAEKKARKKIEKKNKEEEEKAKDLKEGYDDTYDDAFNGNEDKRKEDESEAYNDGADKGVDYGQQDREQAQKDMEEYNRTHEQTRTEIVEEKFVEEKPVEEKTESTSNSKPSSSSSSSSSHSSSGTEIVSEEFVYESSEASNAEPPKKVKSVESHEETKKIKVETNDGTEYESEAKVLVRE